MTGPAAVWPVRILTLVAAALLGLGLIAPCMTIYPEFGQFTPWVKVLRPSLVTPTTYSILSGIFSMIRGGNVGIGLLLLAFSVAFPVAKLAVMAYATQKLADRRPAGAWLTIAHHTGKFSMLDVMVLGLIVVSIKGLPGGSRIVLGWGVWAFAASVVLSLIASILLHRMERDITPTPMATPVPSPGIPGES